MVEACSTKNPQSAVTKISIEPSNESKTSNIGSQYLRVTISSHAYGIANSTFINNININCSCLSSANSAFTPISLKSPTADLGNKLITLSFWN